MLMTLRHLVTATVMASSLALSACGSEEKQTGQPAAAETEGTPAQARAEIAEVRTALDKAVAALKDGDAKQAEELVSEGYLQHFEKVEGPLKKVDAELNEKLEDTIREELRAKITSGGSAAEIEKMVTSIKADLATAEQKLQ
jgi:high-affinity iron transporter